MLRPFAIPLVLLGMCLSSIAFAQQDAAPSEQEAGGAPEAPNKVEISPMARDDEIATRLGDILEATEWFEDSSVKVTDGVVFLRGLATDQEYRSWATDLAQNTQDVAAVVNRMSVMTPSIWNMSPAFAELRSLLAATIQATPLIIFGLIVLLLTWPIAQAVKRFADWSLQERFANALLRGVVAKAAMLPVLLIGIYIVLRVSGLTQLALTVLGGTGIAGLIIGIAFRDIAENFLASILISTQNPFRTGDFIEVADHRGFVQRVSTRGTLLMTLDGNHVQIPNAIIYKSTVTNFSANPNRRVEFVVGIGYDDKISHAQQIVKSILDRHPNVLADPEPRVIVDELGASTVNLRVYAWLDGSKHAPDTVRSSAMRMIKQSLIQEGISMPDEAREIIFPNQVPVRMITQEEETHGHQGGTEPRGAELTEVETEEVWSPGEGSQQSDEDDIQRQAQHSWLSTSDTNLLTNGEHASHEHEATSR